MFTGGVATINADVGLLGLHGKRARLVFACLPSTWPGGFGTHLVCRDSKTTQTLREMTRTWCVLLAFTPAQSSDRPHVMQPSLQHRK